jgi:hypothetical protein
MEAIHPSPPYSGERQGEGPPGGTKNGPSPILSPEYRGEGYVR